MGALTLTLSQPAVAVRAGGAEPGLRIVPLSVPTAQFGVAYEATWQVLGGTAPYTLSDSTLPTWADPPDLTGDIITVTGTPDAVDAVAYLLEVTDDVAAVSPPREGTITTVAVVPDAPTNAAATAGDTTAEVDGDAPASNGGATVTLYRATSSPGGITATNATLPITVTGLTNGVEYTFTLAAQNSAGWSDESDPSNAVTPEAAPSYTPISATGGSTADIEVSGRSWRVHTFNSSADFVVSEIGTNPEELEYLLIGGGGGGGRSGGGGGGGGAGGYRTGTFTPSATTYPVVIGGGGAGAASPGSDGSAGSNSTVFGLTAIGGGPGGGASPTPPATGGSGGGSRGDSTDGAFAGQGSGTSGQGNNGGQGWGDGAVPDNRAGGGGGGAGAVGGDAAALTGGTGGAGITSSITGSAVGRAGGGGGGASASGVAGTASHGGGAGSNQSTPTAGTANTGGGGGASLGGNNGADGGSGVCIIRYPLEAAP